MYNFSINDDWFEITQLVLELTFDVLTSEEINSFLDWVTLYNKKNSVNSLISYLLLPLQVVQTIWP